VLGALCRIILPYAICDTYCDFATLQTAALLERMA
jgi:hypothetical protein